MRDRRYRDSGKRAAATNCVSTAPRDRLGFDFLGKEHGMFRNRGGAWCRIIGGIALAVAACAPATQPAPAPAAPVPTVVAAPVPEPSRTAETPPVAAAT